MITGSIEGQSGVLQRLETVTPKIRASLKTAVTRLSIQLQSYVVANKLSGQVLKRRTGTLARSIQWKVEDTDAGVVGTVGSRIKESNPLKYAAIHEYGFAGPQTVKAHLRTIKQAFGRPLASPVQVNVGAFTRNVNMPARSFMRTSLAENQQSINDEISRAIREALR